MEIPNVSGPDWASEISPSRFASTIRTDPEGCAIALLGMPDDTGVRMNNGRVGAVGGPAAFRSALASYGTAHPADMRWPLVYDAGDVVPADEIHETHDRVTLAVDELLKGGLFPIGIGGGHDLTYPFVRAVAKRHSPMTGIYFDAHLDVREQVGSGMPFRRLIEDCGVKALHVHGLDLNANGQGHVDWFEDHNGTIDAFQPGDPWPDTDLFVSLDLDVIDQAFAPGVSAMNPNGWTPQLVHDWARAGGANSNVRCFDIMELNPTFDQGGRTARLAASVFLSFLRGYTERSS